jgi:hypothetical protein
VGYWFHGQGTTGTTEARMKTTWDVLLATAAVEQRLLNMKKVGAKGSMLQGYKAKTGDEITSDVLLHMALDLGAAEEHLAEARRLFEELRK